MRSTVIWSFLSLALAVGGFAVGCDSDVKVAKSAEGESCDGTADCNDGLKCLQGACYKSAGGGNEAGEGNGTAGTMAGPPAPVLSSEGESCTKRADCEDGLACFNQRCVMEASGEGGGGNLPTLRLGLLGETCKVSADCADGLGCLPGGYPGGQGLPVGFVGVCSNPGGVLAPTGMDCSSECKEAADCCELPIDVHVPYSVLAPYGAGAESCADLAVQLAAVNCDGVLTAANAAKCLAQAAYCDCAAKTWGCEAGRCTYTAGCTDDGAVPEGCPSYTRSGKGVYPLCNTDGACAPEAVAGLCAKDTDCDGEAMADLGLLCEEGECTCYKDTESCYRKCDSPLDCRPGLTCDDDTHVCVPEAGCASDSECAIRTNSSRSRCIDDVCLTGCATDYDCNGNLFNGISTLVCAPDHVCRPIGCSVDGQCSNAGIGVVTPVKMFCAEPAVAPAGTMVNSAITD